MSINRLVHTLYKKNKHIHLLNKEYTIHMQKVSEYVQEIPQSHTADQPTAS